MRRVPSKQTRHVLFADPTDAEIADWGVATKQQYFNHRTASSVLGQAQSGGIGGKHGTIGAVARTDAEAISPLASLAASPTRCTVVWVIRRCLVAARSPTDAVAVSCTRHRRAFIKVVAAHQVSDRVRFSGGNVEDAATAAGRSRRASWRWRHDPFCRRSAVAWSPTTAGIVNLDTVARKEVRCRADCPLYCSIYHQ